MVDKIKQSFRIKIVWYELTFDRLGNIKERVMKDL